MKSFTTSYLWYHICDIIFVTYLKNDLLCLVEIQSVCDNEKYLLISWFVSNVLHILHQTSRDHFVWITRYIHCRKVVVIICMCDTCYILYRTVVAIVCLWLTCYSHYMKVFAVICMSIAGCIHYVKVVTNIYVWINCYINCRTIFTIICL